MYHEHFISIFLFFGKQKSANESLLFFPVKQNNDGDFQTKKSNIFEHILYILWLLGYFILVNETESQKV